MIKKLNQLYQTILASCENIIIIITCNVYTDNLSTEMQVIHDQRAT